MSLRLETDSLRSHLNELACSREDDAALSARYTLRRSPRPVGLYWQLRWLAGQLLRSLKEMRILRPDPWPPGLRQAATSHEAKPLLIWALGTDRDTLREACTGFLNLQELIAGYAPVLVTDVADFSFFSRLGWLVEYLPRLIGDGEAYEHRKLRFLARLYRDAPVLPVRAGLAVRDQANDIRRCLNTQPYDAKKARWNVD
jgi:hypothetical protein